MVKQEFRFKQFSIRQDACAMKVGTDSVLLGGWAMPKDARNVLDIGTGSGLLALMMAQQADAKILALDIDAGAVQQAKINFEASPWSMRLRVLERDVCLFADSTSDKFDYIISNPPYFEQGERSENRQRAIARHVDALTLPQLFTSVAKLLCENGCFALVLPYSMRTEMVRCAANVGLWLNREARVRSMPGEPFVRLLVEFAKKMPLSYTYEEISIEEGERHQYTAAFRRYTANFYL